MMFLLAGPPAGKNFTFALQRTTWNGGLKKQHKERRKHDANH